MSTVLAARLAAARHARGLTQAQVAEAGGLPHFMKLSAWERGAHLPRIDQLVDVAKALRVSLDWLCGLSERGGPGRPGQEAPEGYGGPMSRAAANTFANTLAPKSAETGRRS